MLLIYLPKITSRNRYCLNTVFKHFLAFSNYSLTEDKKQFSEYSGPKFSYAKRPINDEFFIYANGLLEERGIKEYDVPIDGNEKSTILFSHQQESELNYDPFAATFYMISRYEEYLPHRRDLYDRFDAKASMAFNNGFIEYAVVDRWVKELAGMLDKRFNELSFPKNKIETLLTIDIDNAYAYKEKGLIRTMGSLLKYLLAFRFYDFLRQMKVLLKFEKDPFDTYNLLRNLQKRFYLKPIYFFLVGDYGLNDKNISPQNRNFQSLIKSIADFAEVGIHPSFGSNTHKNRLDREIKRLQRIVKRDIKKSRQHFLKLILPETYRRLVEADIAEDYTMGFASSLGFRAGTSKPFPFYDLDEEYELNLLVYPFSIMDATLNYYLHLKPLDAIDRCKKIVDEIIEVDGKLVLLWHNESLSDNKEWKGWSNVLEEILEYSEKQKTKTNTNAKS